MSYFLGHLEPNLILCLSNTSVSTCRCTIWQMLLWRLHQRKGAAPVTGMSTGSGGLGSTVSLLHRSRQLSLQVGWLRCAGRDVWWSYSIKQSVSGLFFFTHIWMNSYKELGTFPRFLFIPREVVWSCVCISAGDNRAVSLLDTQGRRTLLHLVSKADTYGESRSQRKRRVVRLLSSTIYFPFSTITRRNLNKVSLGV